MLQHTKRKVELFEMHSFTMFITILRVKFLPKLRWSNMPVGRFFSRESAIQRGDGPNESIYL